MSLFLIPPNRIKIKCGKMKQLDNKPCITLNGILTILHVFLTVVKWHCTLDMLVGFTLEWIGTWLVYRVKLSHGSRSLIMLKPVTHSFKSHRSPDISSSGDHISSDLRNHTEPLFGGSSNSLLQLCNTGLWWWVMRIEDITVHDAPVRLRSHFELCKKCKIIPWQIRNEDVFFMVCCQMSRIRQIVTVP